jgi:dTDP-4-amino-4,6-dideoxygalactose transaminase
VTAPKPSDARIPYHRPWLGAPEVEALSKALLAGDLVGNGRLGKAFQKRLADALGVRHALFTSSCTSAFSLALMGLGLKPGDEVLMPSFAFVSIANAVLAAGGRPVFADIDPRTFNLDPASAALAVTARTRFLVPVHYAGMACDLDRLMDLSVRKGLTVIEDAAQAVGARWKGKHLGTIGKAGVYSFHATKHFTTGEGGLLVTDDDALAGRLEIMHEKGTNRAAFLRGEVDKYTWVGEGASFVQSDLLAALGTAQLDRLEENLRLRRALADRFLREMAGLPGLTLPVVPAGCEPNWHIFACLVDPSRRDAFLKVVKAQGVDATTHFEPLHASPFGRERLGLKPGSLPVTERVAASLVRLPLYPQLTDAEVGRIVGAVKAAARL